MSNIVETVKESAASALSEHGYAGVSGGNPPDYAQASALQTEVSEDYWLKWRTVVVGQLGGSDSAISEMLAWTQAFDLNKTLWNRSTGVLPAEQGRGGFTVAAWDAGSFNPNPDVIEYNFQAFPFADGFFTSCWTNAHLVATQIGLNPSIAPMPIDGYMIVAIDIESQTALYGCSYPLLPSSGAIAINLPLPNNINQAYIFALIGAANNEPWSPQLPQVAETITDLITGLSGFYNIAENGFFSNVALPSGNVPTGPDWNTGLTCQVPSGPPFA